MLDFLHILLAIALAAVASALGLGVYSMFRGGDFGRRWSNRLMRIRVALQFTAILVLAAAYWWGHRSQ